MQKTRSWQDSFDRLEASRRDEQQMRDAEERQIRLAEAAYDRASLKVAHAEKTTIVETIGFMLADAQSDQAEVLVKPKPPARVAKPRVAKPHTARPKAASAKVAKERAAVPQRPESIAFESHTIAPPDSPPHTTPQPSEPASASPSRVAAEPLLITPLPRNAALAPYRKPGLFGLIGSWLRLAARRPKLPVNLRRPARKDGQPRDDLAALKAENEKLRRQIEALLTLQEVERASTPPWATTPAGDVPARPRRRGGIRA